MNGGGYGSDGGSVLGDLRRYRGWTRGTKRKSSPQTSASCGEQCVWLRGPQGQEEEGAVHSTRRAAWWHRCTAVIDRGSNLQSLHQITGE